MHLNVRLIFRSTGFLLQMKIFVFLMFKTSTVGQMIAGTGVSEINSFILSVGGFFCFFVFLVLFLVVFLIDVTNG